MGFEPKCVYPDIMDESRALNLAVLLLGVVDEWPDGKDSVIVPANSDCAARLREQGYTDNKLTLARARAILLKVTREPDIQKERAWFTRAPHHTAEGSQ
jgi:hypothetical protein